MLVILFLICIFFLIILLSRINIQIKNLQIIYPKIDKSKNNNNLKIIIKLKIFKNITLLKKNLTKKNIKKINVQNIQEKIKIIEKNTSITEDYKKLKKIAKKKYLKIKKIYLKTYIGTENVILTSFLVAGFSSIIFIFLGRNMEDYKEQNINIYPVYNYQNLLNIEFSGIFEIKMIHIINIIYILNKKEGVKKNERTSNRRPYDYSYE